MTRADAATYRLRRFRVAIAAIVAPPWVLQVLLAPFYGWHMSLIRTAFGLALDGLLVWFGWRNPSGIAPILITLRLIAGAALGFWWGGGVVVYLVEQPLSGMRAANCANTSATRSYPTATRIQSQIPTGPALCSTSS